MTFSEWSLFEQIGVVACVLAMPWVIWRMVDEWRDQAAVRRWVDDTHTYADELRLAAAPARENAAEDARVAAQKAKVDQAKAKRDADRAAAATLR